MNDYECLLIAHSILLPLLVTLLTVMVIAHNEKKTIVHTLVMFGRLLFINDEW